MPALSTDQPIYFVTTDHPAGALIPERDVVFLDRKNTVADIAAGQRYYEKVCQVIEVNLGAGTSRDVTREIAREVMHVWANEGDFLYDWQRDFVEMFVSPQAANSFRRAA